MDLIYKVYVLVLLLYVLGKCRTQILCEEGYCREYGFDVGCSEPSQHCGINNETHTGMWMVSPTTCNCCDYCLPLYGEGQPCSVGGPGTGTTVGRCGDGLTCDAQELICKRMKSVCHDAQDDYDDRYEKGEVGALETRPICDGKGMYGPVRCVPTQTCFCQSEEGERLFGEALYQGNVYLQNMQCGCSRIHNKIKRTIASGVRFPVIGPRCTSDGNFFPIQCIGRTCYCVNRITGAIYEDESINLDLEPISRLTCYEETLDLFPENNKHAPYNFTTPCFEDKKEQIELIMLSEEDGYIMDFFNEVVECLPDGNYGRVMISSNGTKVCVNESGDKIENYEAQPGTAEFQNMNCNCALTSYMMGTSLEKPVCCKNGNFRAIQCRRGSCRCVDQDGRQTEKETDDVTSLSCYNESWRAC